MKASEIDWSKAPKWATGRGVVGLCNSPVWLSQDQYTYVDGQQGGRTFYFGSGEGFSLDEIREVAERPSPWNGTGLPPVGVVCQVEPHNTYWGLVTLDPVEMKIAAYHDDLVWLIDKEGKNHWTRTDKADFRPIRTPEQIAAEKRKRAVDEMQRLASTDPMHGRKVCAALYDAGYRKVEGDKQ